MPNMIDEAENTEHIKYGKITLASQGSLQKEAFTFAVAEHAPKESFFCCFLLASAVARWFRPESSHCEAMDVVGEVVDGGTWNQNRKAGLKRKQCAPCLDCQCRRSDMCV
jgi:hypothetical protein